MQVEKEDQIYRPRNKIVKTKFPQDIENFRSLDSFEDFMAAMAKQKLFKDINAIFYIQKTNANGFLQAKCKKCDACIKCKHLPSCNKLVLVRFQNQHNHDLSMFVVDDNSKQRIHREIIELQKKSQSIDSIKKFIIEKYSITTQIFDIILKEANSLVADLSSFHTLFATILQMRFDLKDYYFNEERRIEQQVSNLRYFSVSSPQMKQNYQKYWQFMYIHTIRIKHYEQNLQRNNWRLLIFAGFDFDFKFVPFGIAVFLEEANLKLKTKEIYNKFLQQRGNLAPDTVMHSMSLDSVAFDAFQELAYQQNLQTRNMKDCLVLLGQIKKELLKKTCTDIVDSENYHAYLQNEKTYLDFFNHLLDADIDQQQRRICYELSESPEFYSPSATPSKKFCPIPLTPVLGQFKEQFKNIEKQCINPRNGFKTTILSILNILQPKQIPKKQIELQKLKLENYFSYHGIKLMRMSVTFKVFQLIKKQLSYVAKQRISCYQNDNAEVCQTKLGKQSKFYVSREGDNWKCTCELPYKNGLPCRHLLRWYIFKDIKTQGIHNRWLFDPELLIQHVQQNKNDKPIQIIDDQ